MEETTPQLKPMSNRMFFTGLLLTFTVIPAFVISIWFFSTWSPFDNTPIKIPIDLSKAGSVVEVKMRAWGKVHYKVDLDFIFKSHKEDNGTDYKKLFNILGDRTYDPRTGVTTKTGAEIPIKLTIYKLDHRDARTAIFDESFITKGRDYWGSRDMGRVLSAFSLEHGKFIIRVENLEGFQELADRKVNLTIYRPSTK